MEDDPQWKTTSEHVRRLKFGVLTVFINIRLIKVLWFVEDDLRCKTTFSECRPLVEDDPCMLPSPLCGIFLLGFKDPPATQF